MSIKLFDTTLRDGTQREGVSLTAEDKARIARELDSLGIHYVEAGFPASNPKDLEFFEGFDASELETARLVAFTRARRPGGEAGEDPAVTLLPALSAPVACIVAKSWGLHVEKVLRTTPEMNLASVKRHGCLPRGRRQRGDLRRRALLRRLQGRPGSRALRAARGGGCRGDDPGTVRHERRNAPDGAQGRRRPHRARVSRRRGRHPHPQRRRLRGGERPGRRRGRCHPRPGDHQRGRRADRATAISSPPSPTCSSRWA